MIQDEDERDNEDVNDIKFCEEDEVEVEVDVDLVKIVNVVEIVDVDVVEVDDVDAVEVVEEDEVKVIDVVAVVNIDEDGAVDVDVIGIDDVERVEIVNFLHALQIKELVKIFRRSVAIYSILYVGVMEKHMQMIALGRWLKQQNPLMGHVI